jgi:hypothetical protein
LQFSSFRNLKKINIFLKRQVTKNDVDSLLARYSTLNLTQNYSKEEKQINLYSDVSSSYQFLNIAHFETTVCEEYQLIEHVFHKILREIKNCRKTLSANSINNNQDKILEISTSSLKKKLKLANSKRSKSPKLNLSYMINQKTSILTDANNNNKNNNNNNNLSSNALFSIDPSYNNNSINGSIFLTNHRSRNSSPSFKNGDINKIDTVSRDTTLNSPTTIGFIKKNNSKFPFFNKILNKSS